MAHRIGIVVASLFMIVGTVVAGPPVEIVSSARSVSAGATAFSDFGCSDSTDDSAIAPDGAAWDETVSTMAECDFAPFALSSTTTRQVSSMSPYRLAALVDTFSIGDGSEYVDPESHEFFCSGVGGGGDAIYEVTFNVLEPVSYRLSASVIPDAFGNCSISLAGPGGFLFFVSIDEEMTGTLMPGEHFLNATCFTSYEEPCAGGGGTGAFFEFSLDIGCEGDTNDDGQVDIDDVVNVILDFGTDGAVHDGDLDGSGLVDIDDVIVAVLNFGACPGA